MRSLLALIIILAAVLLPGVSRAGQFSIYEENDTFGLDSPSDRYYTQGLRFEYAWRAQRPFVLARALSRLPLYRASAPNVVEAVALAQNMYTPEIITDPEYNPYDRPFAAWLYAAYRTFVISTFNDWQDTYELYLGVVGPWAQGDEVQSWFHDLIGDEDDPTYVNQIPNSPVVMLTFARKWSSIATFAEHETWPTYVLPGVTVRVGNVMTDVGLGITLLAGFHTPVDFAAGSINPSIGGTEDAGRFRLYAHAGIDGRAVLYNAFLDGTAWRESASIERNELVADYKAGITASWRWFRFSFTQVWRTPEIETRSNFQNFGSLQLGFGGPL
jgi:lipid A 3-O-deacylase